MDFKIKTVDVALSTQDHVHEAARAGEAAGFVLQALRQKKGRGRHGRVWDDGGAGSGNLMCSVLLRPERAERGSLSLVCGLALAECVEDAVLKWPNDVMIDGRKCAGILLEAETDYVVLGVGVNLKFAPEGAAVVPGEHEPAAFLERFLEVFGPLYAAWEARGFDADLRARWLSRSYEIGARMSVKSAGGMIEGAFAGLAENGALLLRDGNGTIRTVSSGELLMDGEHNAAGD